MAETRDPHGVRPAGPPEPPEPARTPSAASADAAGAAPPVHGPFKIALYRTPFGPNGMAGILSGYLGVSKVGSSLFPNYGILVSDKSQAVVFEEHKFGDNAITYVAKNNGANQWFSLTRFSYVGFFMLPGMPSFPDSNLRPIAFDARSRLLTCDGRRLSYYGDSPGQDDYLYFWDDYRPFYVDFLSA